MICLLPQFSRQIIDGQDKIFISLSFDKIHWCEPYPLKIIQEGNSFSILALLAIFSLIALLLASIKMIFFDTNNKNSHFGRRNPPRKKPDSFNKEIRHEEDPFVFNRKVLGSSFL